MEPLQYLSPTEWMAIEIAIPIIVLAILFWWSGVVRYIPNDRLGILEKLWSFRGSISNGFIALNREAGYQPEVVRGGLHFFMPFQYSMHRANLVTIPQGQIGYVFARDGKPLPPTQTLASNTEADDFQDVRGFLEKGGQKGPQRKILREGTYAINLAQFIVLTAQAFFRQGLVVWSIGIAYILYDTALLVFTAWNIRDLRAAPAAVPGEHVTFGVIVAAHNEAAVIASTIDRLAAQDAPPEIILIADDGSSDDTAGVLARRYGLTVPALGGMATGSTNLPSLRWLRLPHGGKAGALNAAVLAIDTEVRQACDWADQLPAGSIHVSAETCSSLGPSREWQSLAARLAAGREGAEATPAAVTLALTPRAVGANSFAGAGLA